MRKRQGRFLFLWAFTIFGAVFFAGCDIFVMSQVRITPSQKDVISTQAVSAADWEKSIELFKSIAQKNGCLLQEPPDRHWRCNYYAKGGNWYGGMTLTKEETAIIVEVCQHAGPYEAHSYKKVKKELFKSFSEAFGKDRVTITSNLADILEAKSKP